MQKFLNTPLGSVIIFLLIYNTASAQLFTKSDYAKMSLCFVAGASDGYNQTLYAHYDTWKQHHPNANDQWWNPAISWENKYKDAPNGDFRPAYIGSKTFLVFTTDAYHLTRMIDHTSMLSALTISGLSNGKNAWGYIFDFVKFFLARSLGFTLTYNIIYH